MLNYSSLETIITFVDGESETDVTTGSFSINELTLTSDKEVYVYNEGTVIISFNLDSIDDLASLKAYYVYFWGPVGRDDKMIFNPYDAEGLIEDGAYKDGVVSLDVARFIAEPDNDNYRLDVGTNLIYVVYRTIDNERFGGFIEVEVIEEHETVPVDPNLVITPISDVEQGSDVLVEVTANETFSGAVSVLVGGEVVATINVENGYGNVTVLAGNFTLGSNTVNVTSVGDDKFTAGEDSVTFTVKEKIVPPTPSEPVDPALTITIADITEGSDAVIVITTNTTFSGNVLVKIGTANYTVGVTNGSGSLPVSGLSIGLYNATAIFTATDLFIASEKNTTFNVKAKVATAISASPVTTTYATSKNIVVTLKDANGNVLAGKEVIIVINGASKTVKTDDKGQATLAIATSLAPKTYDATFTFAGDSAYTESTGTVKVTVKKATPKLTAKKKTFKAKKKSKKYTVTLKTDKGKALNKVKVTLKVKGKKYTATVKKGKATFNLKKLTKKGKYKATVTFAGNKYYNKVTVKKVKITVKK